MNSKTKKINLIIGYSVFFAFLVSILFFIKLGISVGNGWTVKGLHLDKIKVFPWTDVAENISIGFLLSKGYILYDHVVMNHMHGIPATIMAAIFLFNHIVAGPDTFNSLFAISIFVSLFVQSILIMNSNIYFLRMKIFPSVLCSLSFLLIYGIFFDAAVLMSESITLVLVYTSVSHLIKIIVDKRANVMDLIFAIALIFLSIAIGFTAIFFWPLYLLFILSTIFLSEINRGQSKNQSIWPLIFVSFLLIITTIPVLKSGMMHIYYWNIVFNGLVNSPNIIGNLQGILNQATIIFPDGFSSIFLLEPSFFIYITLALCVATFCKKTCVNNRWAISIFLFFICSYIAFHWRFLTGYKAMPVVGCFAPLFVYIYLDQIKLNSCIMFPRSIVHIFNLLMILIAFLIFKFNYIDEDTTLKQFGICPQEGGADNCSCLVSDAWGPQFFAINNVAPCKGYFPSLPPPFFEVENLKNKFVQDFRDGKIAVNVHAVNFTPFLGEDIRDMYAGAKCKKFSSVSEICHQ